jgi:hypothetical protein
VRSVINLIFNDGTPSDTIKSEIYLNINSNIDIIHDNVYVQTMWL